MAGTLHNREPENPSVYIDIYWSDNSYDEHGFEIQRRRDDSSWESVGTVGRNETHYHDEGDLEHGHYYYYRVRAYRDCPENTYHSGFSDEIYLGPVPVDENQDSHIPLIFRLLNNYPNPFNTQTTTEYALPETSLVTIKIYDLLGRKAEILTDKHQQPGHHQVTWDASNATSGIYLYRIQAGEFGETKKMLLLK